MEDRSTTPLGNGLLRAGLILGLVTAGTGLHLGQTFSTDSNKIEGLRQAWRSMSLDGFIARGHYWGSFALILTLTLAVASLFWFGDFKKSKYRWLGAVIMLLTAVGLQVTGNALPMDQHDVRSVVVETSIAESVPGVGAQIANAARFGPEVTQKTITNWFELHRMHLTIAFVLGVILATAGTMQKSGGKAAAKTQNLATFLPILIFLGLSVAFPAPSGDLALAADYSSSVAQPSWYVLPMHALLKVADSIRPGMGWIGAMVLPGIAVGGLVLAPWLFKKVSDPGRKSLLLAALMSVGIVTGMYFTPPAPITGVQPVPQETGLVKDPKQIDQTLVTKGRILFEQTCAGCHGVGGAGTSGYPSLKGFGTKVNDREWLIRFISDPNQVRPGSRMPAFKHLPAADVEAIAEMVRNL